MASGSRTKAPTKWATARKRARRPSPPHRLEAPNPPWTPRAVAEWDGGEKREVALSTETCVWYTSGFHPVVMRWVWVRDPHGG